MGEKYAEREKKKVFERPRMCARARSSRVSPCPLRICTCNRRGVYRVLVRVYERKGERERSEIERLEPASQHFIPLHSFLSSLGGSY